MPTHLMHVWHDSIHFNSYLTAASALKAAQKECDHAFLSSDDNDDDLGTNDKKVISCENVSILVLW